jgi:ferrous iron transport protein B
MEIIAAKRTKSIAIIGNPNVGKSSIFNQLTGLNQKIGNYPGVTVDKSTGRIRGEVLVMNLLTYPGHTAYIPIQKMNLLPFGC